MSRTDKDKPWRLGGQQHRYHCSPTGHANFTRTTRQQARAKAKAALRNGREPQPRYPVEREYFD